MNRSNNSRATRSQPGRRRERPSRPLLRRQVKVDPRAVREVIGRGGATVKGIARMCRDGCRINRTLDATEQPIPGCFTVTAYSQTALAAAEVFLKKKAQDIISQQKTANAKAPTETKQTRRPTATTGRFQGLLEDSDDEESTQGTEPTQTDLQQVRQALGQGAWMGKRYQSEDAQVPRRPSQPAPAKRGPRALRTGFRHENDIRSRRQADWKRRQERQQTQAAYEKYLEVWDGPEGTQPLDLATWQTHHRPATQKSGGGTQTKTQGQAKTQGYQTQASDFPTLGGPTRSTTTGAQAWGNQDRLEVVRSERAPTPPPPEPSPLEVLGGSPVQKVKELPDLSTPGLKRPMAVSGLPLPRIQPIAGDSWGDEEEDTQLPSHFGELNSFETADSWENSTWA